MATNNSVMKSFKILEVISQYPEGVTFTNIVKETGLPKSTVYDICNALYQVDAIYFKNPISKTYVIGSKMYIMGQVYTQNSNFILASDMYLKSFADKFGLTVSAVKRLHNTAVNVYKYESKNSKVITPELGAQVKLHESASGKVFLAYMEENDRKERLIKLGVSKNKTLINELEKIKNQGYAFDGNVESEYIYSIAVPVFNFENKTIGVITATSIKNKNQNTKEQISDLVDISKTVSRILGYRK